MSKYVRQHIVPRVYLKYFSRDSFVYVFDTTNPYRKKIEKKGIGHRVFTSDNYYDTSIPETRKYLEETFSRFEATYNEIIPTIQKCKMQNNKCKM